ncbi:MAG: PilT/PilU family type 4a pilus ATPase, partial [Eggerthellaceae bacterium]|nr:PilT/PilU family type 4a pilus ATPase [Eggerthellaceae bacterium]
MEFRQLLKQMVDINASDIFIIAGLPFSYELAGRQIRLDTPVLAPKDTEEFVRALYLESNRNIEYFTENKNRDDDFSFALPGIGRFRANVFRQRGSYSAVIRIIPFGLPDPEAFGIPEKVLQLSRFQKGLVLITGPAGSGKSTTLACIVNRLNQERSGHIITMEDPIEYIHEHKSCMVNQREIGTDVPSFAASLRAALREDPDVILVGEMRDRETIEGAITASETGHLVMSTLHTSDAATTVDRIVDVFPPHHQQQIRTQLAGQLIAVCSQQLVPTADGSGRIAALEL